MRLKRRARNVRQQANEMRPLGRDIVRHGSEPDTCFSGLQNSRDIVDPEHAALAAGLENPFHDIEQPGDVTPRLNAGIICNSEQARILFARPDVSLRLENGVF